MKKIGFIDYYLDEWHANNYPQLIKEVSGGELEVTCAYAVIDSPIGGMTTDAWCEKYGIPRCYSIEEVIEQSDLLVVLSPDNCEKHEELCQIPLRSGKPTYIDKTFAPDYETAKRIFDIAEASGTPCYSTSALRFADEYKDIDRSKVTAITSVGPLGFETYAIHQLEPIVMLMNEKVKRVMYIPGQKWYSAVLEFADGRMATLAGFMDGAPFQMSIASSAGNKTITVESDFFHNFIVELCDFFLNGTAKVPHEETLTIMAVRGAVLKAHETPNVWVEL